MYNTIKNILFTLDPETAHDVIKNISPVLAPALRLVIRAHPTLHSPLLRTKIGGEELQNPIGLAAGFDKNGDVLPLIAALGFGYAELGSITAEACSGNPKPRVFRLPDDESLINFMGLPNIGATAFAHKMSVTNTSLPYGVNIAKTPGFVECATRAPTDIGDFVKSFEQLHAFGFYTTINLSCPNTGDTKTFEDLVLFKELATAIMLSKKSQNSHQPIFLKLSPDLEDAKLHALVERACEFGFDGFVLGNTTRQRPALRTELDANLQSRGGLSGRALAPLSNALIKKVFQIVGRNKTLVAVGGINSMEDLLTKLQYGAELFQIYTGLIYQGPFFVKTLLHGLVQHCEKMGVKNYRDVVGLAH